MHRTANTKDRLHRTRTDSYTVSVSPSTAIKKSRLYLVPRHITNEQLQKIFGNNLRYIEEYNTRDRLIVLNTPATLKQDSIMQIIYNS